MKGARINARWQDGLHLRGRGHSNSPASRACGREARLLELAGVPLVHVSGDLQPRVQGELLHDVP